MAPAKENGTDAGNDASGRNQALAKVVWRDVVFLILGAIALQLIGYVETNAYDASLRTGWGGSDSSCAAGGGNPVGVVDTGFFLTKPLYEFLARNRSWNDVAAGVNSLALAVPSVYAAYTMLWVGDFSLVFRLLTAQLLRSFCGWFTYLPPDNEYLMSYYDFPDVFQCLAKDCSGDPAKEPVLPFVSFFSGHVATIVICANHMYMYGHKKLAVLLHIMNVFQVIRLLATRGHYSIDIIIGWCVAVYVGRGAGRLGRQYGRGVSFQAFLPETPTEAFEAVTGIGDALNEKRMSMLLKNPDVQKLINSVRKKERDDVLWSVKNDTTAQLAAEQLKTEYDAYFEKK